jgi:hypothetical protein
MFDLVFVCSNLNVKGKGYFYNSGKSRSFGAKWVRMGGKIKTYEGCFAKKQELTFKPQIEVKLPKGFKWSVDFK